MRPVWRIDVDGAASGAALSDSLIRLDVTDHAGVLADELTFDVSNPLGAIEAPRRGVELTAALGVRGGALIEMGRFVVDYVEATGPVRVIRVRAAAVDLRRGAKSPKTRAWEKTTLGEIAAAIAKEHDLEPHVAPALAGVAYEHLSQTGESDVHFLTRLAEELGAIVKVADRKLAIVFRGVGETVSGERLPRIDLSLSDFETWRVIDGDRSRHQTCSAYWHDNNASKRKKVSVGKGDPVYEMRRSFPDAASAERAASAKLAFLNRSARRVVGALAGPRLDLMAEQPLRLFGLDSVANGDWITTRVVHSLDGALTTKFEAEAPT